MHIVRTPGSARAIARTLKRPVGFVPTMGALHEGHLSLVRRARSENASVIASIFVNPMQFSPAEDFAKYPRAFESDVAALEAGGVDVLYAPSAERMYPAGFSATVDVGTLGSVLEGARRPGHFAGVATVVLKLLSALEPTSMYLGQKDVQQTAVLRAMVRDLDLPTNVVVAPTVRESDGLALSSRNVYLTPQERAAAPSFYRALKVVEAALAGGETNAALACAAGSALLSPPLEWEYLAIVDPASFAELRRVEGAAVIVAVVRAGATRLLDNVPVAAANGVDPILTPARPLLKPAGSRGAR